MSLNIEDLINAVDNNENESLMNLTFKEVKKIKNDMLQKLGLDRETLIKYNKSLKEYRYIDEISDIKFGAYIRWIPLSDPQKIKLTTGGFVCDVKINDVNILCRNNFNRVFEFKMTSSLVFQKLSQEEKYYYLPRLFGQIKKIESILIINEILYYVF